MSKKESLTEKMRITPSSGNIYTDLGYKNAETMLAKATLVIYIERAIKERGLTQEQAAKILGIDQPKISALLRGKFDGFSIDRLLRFLNKLGCDVQFSVSRPHPDSPGHVIA